jgi:hypothetical protein
MVSSRHKSSRGQLLIPALFVFPSLFLFIYLIYETAKLSREKIRHQFAIDSAAFIEMSNYSDFLNRSAYVNGAFPMRIFKEMNAAMPPVNRGEGCPTASMMDVMFMNGDFPMDSNDLSWESQGSEQAYTAKAQWKIEFCSENSNPPCFTQFDGTSDGEPPGGDGDQLNAYPPPERQCMSHILNDKNVVPGGNCHEFIDLATAKACGRPVEYTCIAPYTAADSSQDCLQPGSTFIDIWAKVYTLLGQVEGAQMGVLGRLAQNHHFLQKSYWLNTSGQGPDAADAQSASLVFDRGQAAGFVDAFQPDCLDYVTGLARVFQNGDPLSAFNKCSIGPYDPAPPCLIKPAIPLQGLNACPGAGGTLGGGLFQFMDADPSVVGGAGGGGAIQHGWYSATDWHIVNPKTDSAIAWGSGAENFFGVAFQTPAVCAKVTLGENEPYASVWPDPTPKYQTRLRPCDIMPGGL